MFYPKSFLTFCLLLLIFDVSLVSGIQCFFAKETYGNLTFTGSIEKEIKACSGRCVTYIIDSRTLYEVGFGCDVDDLSKSIIPIEDFYDVWKNQTAADPSKVFWYDQYYAIALCDKDSCNDPHLFKTLIQNGKNHTFYRGAKISDVIYNVNDVIVSDNATDISPTTIKAGNDEGTTASDAIRYLPTALMSLMMIVLI